MKQALIGAAAILALLLVISLVMGAPWDESEARRLEALNDSLTAVFDSTALAADSLIAVNDSVMSVVDSVNVAADSADARADRESVRASQTAARLRRALSATEGGDTTPTGAVALLDTLQAQHARAIAQKDTAIAELRSNVDRLTDMNADLAVQLVKVTEDARAAMAVKDSTIAFWKDAAQPSPLVSILGFNIDLLFGPQITVGPDLVGGGIAVAPGAGLHLAISR